MYNDRANLPFGITTDVTGTYTLADIDKTTNVKTISTKSFTHSLNLTVNVNMPFSIFFE